GTAICSALRRENAVIMEGTYLSRTGWRSCAAIVGHQGIIDRATVGHCSCCPCNGCASRIGTYGIVIPLIGVVSRAAYTSRQCHTSTRTHRCGCGGLRGDGRLSNYVYLCKP